MGLRIRRALMSVSNKEGIAELAQALTRSGTEIVATGRTARVIEDGGTKIRPIESLSGSPEAFQGRMKTLSFAVCSGILYRRSDAKDLEDLEKLRVSPIDCVVVNFYPFEEARRKGLGREELVEQIDIGGPTLVRAAAKNAPDVLVLTHPSQYRAVISELDKNGEVPEALVRQCSAEAWQRVLEYDMAIAESMGVTKELRYGENPHQQGWLSVSDDTPIRWPLRPEQALTKTELSYNNILDLTAAYGLAGDLRDLQPQGAGVVIVKHNNPCGVASIPKTSFSSAAEAQLEALKRAWEGDPVSAFGGVVVFTDPIGIEAAKWLADRFIELVAAPDLSATEGSLEHLLQKRKRLKAVCIERFGEIPEQNLTRIPGGMLWQTSDRGNRDQFEGKTKVAWPKEKIPLSRFGVAICRSLKSNAVALVREIPGIPEGLQLVGAGQGQPNRVEALKALAVPRARSVLKESGGELEDCVLISDAFFPFRDTVDVAAEEGIRWIVQPGGSIKDEESVRACDEKGLGMAFTGVRHFRH